MWKRYPDYVVVSLTSTCYHTNKVDGKKVRDTLSHATGELLFLSPHTANPRDIRTPRSLSCLDATTYFS
jgi:hypothetical protein